MELENTLIDKEQLFWDKFMEHPDVKELIKEGAGHRKKEEELKMWRSWKESGDKQEYNKLIKSLKPLAIQSAGKYTGGNLPRPVLEAKAVSLLADSLHTYDPNKGQLNTHVVNNMKPLYRYTANYKDIGYIPEHRVRQIPVYKGAANKLSEKFGREPTIAELSGELGWAPHEVERTQVSMRSDLVASESYEGVFQPESETMELLQYVYFELEPQEQLIFEYLHGKKGKPGMTLNDIAVASGTDIGRVKRTKEKIAKRVKEFM